MNSNEPRAFYATCKAERDAAYQALRDATTRDAYRVAFRAFMEIMESQREMRRIRRNERRLTIARAINL